MLILTLLSGAQAIVTPTSNIASTLLVVLTGIFISGTSVESAALVQLGVKHENIGVATGIMVAVRGVGGAIGQTVYLSILENRLTSNIPTMVAEPLAKAGVPLTSLEGVIEALLGGITTSPLLATLTPTQLGVAALGIKSAYANSFRLIYLVSIAFGVVAVVSGAFTLNARKLMTNAVAVKLNEGAHITGTMDTGEGHYLNKKDGAKFGDDEFIERL